MIGRFDRLGSIERRRSLTLLYEAANVMLTRHKGQLKLEK
jgi:hypothetical protein